MSEDWADAKAREWCDAWGATVRNARGQIDPVPLVAALLREERASLLSEVRRVVEDERPRWEFDALAPLACESILARLEALR